MSDDKLDPRTHAIRADLADERLKNAFAAPRYASGQRHQLIRPIVPLKARPQPGAAVDSEVLFGERMLVFEIANGWAWVQLERDGYVGYVPADALSPNVVAPTHRVDALGTFVYPIADIKAPPIMHLSLGAEVTTASQDERFAKLASGPFVIARHLAPIDRHARDFVDVAERFVGVPYLWAGRSRMGLDCSGLVQISLEAAGYKTPRDSDMQQRLGEEVTQRPDYDGLERGDLVFWRGHVGIMVDSVLMLHANAHHMCVAIEPLAMAAERSAKAGQQIMAIRRLAKHMV